MKSFDFYLLLIFVNLSKITKPINKGLNQNIRRKSPLTDRYTQKKMALSKFFLDNQGLKEKK